MSGSQIGQILGMGAGFAIGGPPGMAIGGTAGGAIGGAIDPTTGQPIPNPTGGGISPDPGLQQDQRSAQFQAQAANAQPQLPDPNQQ